MTAYIYLFRRVPNVFRVAMTGIDGKPLKYTEKVPEKGRQIDLFVLPCLGPATIMRTLSKASLEIKPHAPPTAGHTVGSGVFSAGGIENWISRFPGYLCGSF